MRMKIQCPQCGKVIPAENVNIATDMALCGACNEAFKVSECADLDAVNEDVLADPPSGAWYRGEFGGFSVGASTRSPIAFLMVPFMCVWSSVSLGVIYGSQIVSGKFSLMFSLFGIPFLLMGILFWTFTLMAICGKVVVTVQDTDGTVFAGIGPIGWRRRFDWSEVKVIREEASIMHYPGGYMRGIIFEGKGRLKFGTSLNEKRRYFMLSALKYLKATVR